VFLSEKVLFLFLVSFSFPLEKNSAKNTTSYILQLQALTLIGFGLEELHLEVLTSLYTFQLATLQLPDVETGLAVAMVMMDKCPSWQLGEIGGDTVIFGRGHEITHFFGGIVCNANLW